MKIEKRKNFGGTNFQVSCQLKGASILSCAVRETSISGAIFSGLSYSSFIQSKIGQYISGTGLSGATSEKGLR